MCLQSIEARSTTLPAMAERHVIFPCNVGLDTSVLWKTIRSVSILDSTAEPLHIIMVRVPPFIVQVR